MGCKLAATGAAGVEGDAGFRRRGRVGEFDEDATDFFDLFVGAEDVLVAEQVSEAEFARLGFGFSARVEGAVFGAQLLGRIAGHPESFFESHTYLSFCFCGATYQRVERVHNYESNLNTDTASDNAIRKNF